MNTQKRPGIEKRVAIVTGAGSGIGRAVALGMLGEDYAVALAGRRRDALEDTRNQATKNAEALIAPTDVGDPASVAALFAAVRERFGRLDVLFNNAGTSAPSALPDELNVEQWQAVVNVNLTGAFLCTREAFSLMRRQSPRGGRIINNGSIAATSPRPRSIAYSATKHAITGLTKATALDGRPFDIACGQIDIGNARTPMTAGVVKGTLQADGELAPEPYLELEHVVQAVLYMAGLPLEANVLSLTVMATKMPFVGRG